MASPQNKIGLQQRIIGLQYPATEFPFDYHFKMKWWKYDRKDPSQEGTVSPIGFVYLPVPENLFDPFSIEWGPEDMGAIEAYEAQQDSSATLANLGGRIRNSSSYDQLTTEIEKWGKEQSLGDVFSGLGDVAMFKGARMMQETAMGGFIAQTAGVIPDPHPSLVFKGIGMRTHDFNWRFAPKTKADSSYLRYILWYLKSRALPEAKSPFLMFPDICDIETTLEIGFKFKRSALTRISVNYTPESGSAWLVDKYPVAVNLSLTFNELEYFTRADVKF